MCSRQMYICMLPFMHGNKLNSKYVATSSLVKITILSRARKATPNCSIWLGHMTWPYVLAIWLGHMAHMFIFPPPKFVTDKDVWWAYQRHSFESMITIRLSAYQIIDFSSWMSSQPISFLYGSKPWKATDAIDVGDCWGVAQ